MKRNRINGEEIFPLIVWGVIALAVAMMLVGTCARSRIATEQTRAEMNHAHYERVVAETN